MVVVGGGVFLIEGAYYSLPLCVLKSRRRPSVAVGVFIFDSSMHCKVTPIPPPTVSRTNLKSEMFFDSVCVCMTETHCLRQTTSHISHSPSSRLLWTYFFKQILAPTLFLLTVRGFVSSPRYKTPIHSRS